MIDILKNNIVGLVAIVIAIIGCYTPVQQLVQQAGGTTNYDTVSASGLQIGTNCNNSFASCNGTTIGRINTAVCYIAPYAATIVASSSVEVDCQGTAGWNAGATSALTGVTLGDNVILTLSTTTASGAANGGTYGGIVATAASASTTAGHIQVTITNLTGGTFTWPVTTVASGTASFIVTR